MDWIDLAQDRNRCRSVSTLSCSAVKTKNNIDCDEVGTNCAVRACGADTGCW
jgi:hypothetical protein